MDEKRGEQEAPAKVNISSKKLLAASINKRVDYYLSKSTFDELDLYYLVKDFFREFLELKYEFSLEELKKELDKVFLENDDKAKITEFIDKIKTIEYEDNKYDSETLIKLMKEFSTITDTLTRSLKEEKRGFFAKLFGIKKKNKKEIRTTVIKTEVEHTQEQPKEDITPTINDAPPIKERKKKKETEVKKEPEKKEETKEKKKPEKSLETPKEEKIKYDVPDIDSEDYDWISETAEAKIKADKQKKQKKKKDKSEKENNKNKVEKNKEIDNLIDEGKKESKKEKLTEIYKKINELYEKETPENKTKYYPELLNVYDKIAKAK